MSQGGTLVKVTQDLCTRTSVLFCSPYHTHLIYAAVGRCWTELLTMNAVCWRCFEYKVYSGTVFMWCWYWLIVSRTGHYCLWCAAVVLELHTAVYCDDLSLARRKCTKKHPPKNKNILTVSILLKLGQPRRQPNAGCPACME